MKPQGANHPKHTTLLYLNVFFIINYIQLTAFDLNPSFKLLGKNRTNRHLLPISQSTILFLYFSFSRSLARSLTL